MMLNQKLYFKIITSLLFTVLLLTNIVPTQAESIPSPLFNSGDFLWAKSLNNQSYYSWNEGRNIAADVNGNAYTTGFFSDTIDFDPGAGTFNLTSAGGPDIFISKLDNNGNFVWAKNIGGPSGDYGYGITLDATGNLYVTGYYSGTVDFDPGAGTSTLTSIGDPAIYQHDAFVLKLDNNGNFVWAKSIGSTTGEGRDIALDSNGNIYVTGDQRVSKLDNDGNFIWTKNSIEGAMCYGEGYGISIDSNNNVYTTGYYTDSTCDFDPGPDIFTLPHIGLEPDIFVSKLDSNGNFVWAKSMGGALSEKGTDIANDSSDNIYITGFFADTTDFDPNIGTINLISTGQTDIFVSKLDSNGNLIWAKNMGGGSSDYGYSIAVDQNNNVYTTGYTGSIDADFDPGPSVVNSGYGIFVSKLDGNGGFTWVKKIGAGFTYDFGIGIATDINSNIYITGTFQKTGDFDPGPNVYNLTSTSQKDIFITKLGNVVPNSEKAITAFSFTNPAVTGIITGTNIAVSVPAGTDVTALVATFTTTGASVTVGGVTQVSDLTPNDFTNPVMYHVTATDGSTQDYTVTVTIGDVIPTFSDVPSDHWAFPFVESLYNAGITGGCFTSPLMYCPDATVTRAQMAIFILRGIYGSTYTPPPASGTVFTDVPASYWAVNWIEQLAAEGITGGCGGGNYCPDATITRAQMAIFLLRGEHGSAYTPPVATGTVFTDVPLGSFADSWIEQLALEGVTAGCGGGNYCPDNSVTRAEMAVFLVRVFTLP